MKKTYRLGLYLGLASWLAVGLLLALLAVIRTGQQLDSDAQRVADGLTGQLYRQQSDYPAAAQSLLQRWDLASYNFV